MASNPVPPIRRPHASARVSSQADHESGLPFPTPPTQQRRCGVLRSIGLGLIIGAADDDPSAIGTYASAGAAFGPALLWTAPLILPMMFTVVYLSGKVGQITGQGLFTVIRRHYSRKLLYFLLLTALVGNSI